MKYRNLGKSGLKVSELSYGSWVTFGDQVDTSKAEDIFALCLDNGVNFFDNAEGYARGQSEIIMGKALANLNRPRDSYIVSSKVFFGSATNPVPNQTGLSRKHVVEACHQALKRLQVDYLDLYFCHRPDPDTPIEETVFTMDSLIRQGKVMYWGTSEWSAQEITQAHLIAEKNHLIGPTMEQPEYNMLQRRRFENEYARLYTEFGMGTTIWSPLASGLLTGKYLTSVPEGSRATLASFNSRLNNMLESKRAVKRMEKVRKIHELTKDWGVPMTQLALAWCLKNPNVSTVILGASNRQQLEQNLELEKADEVLTQKALEELELIISINQ